MRLLAALLLLMWSAPALAEWREAETAHFKIVSSGDERSLIRFAQRLESFHSLLKLATGVNDANRRVVKVRVFLVPSIGDVRRILDAPNSGVGGFYRPQDDGAIAVVPRNTGEGAFSG